MDYSEFETEDFASDDFFISWVLDADQESIQYWKKFQVQHPHLRSKIEKARELVLNLRAAEESGPSPSQAEKIWSRIDKRLTISSVAPPAEKRHFGPLKVAATVSIVILMMIGIGHTLRMYSSTHTAVVKTTQENDFIEEVNTTGNLLKIHLSDGSTVTLENKSRLRYPKDFTPFANREVYLIGEGFFDVAKNIQRPFLVHTKEITTKVLGTSFRIKAFDHDKDIVVAVKKGKVTVFSSGAIENKTKEREEEVNGVLLTPNQQVIYSRSEDSFNKTLIEKPEVVSADKEIFNFTFENAPVKEVFAVLEKAYGVEIIFDEEVMQHCYLTVPLGNESLYEKLRIICRTIGASYELIDASLVVTSKGCYDK